MSDETLDALLLALSNEGFALPNRASVRDYPDIKDLQAADERAWEDNRSQLRRALEVAEII